jgi:predicted nuclease with TOPRIM domain
MSERESRVRHTLLRLLGIEPRVLESHDVIRDLIDENERLRVLFEKSSQEVQELRDLTKMLAINQAQLASDVYVIYTQVKNLRDGTSLPDEIESEIGEDEDLSDSPSEWTNIIRTGRRGGTGGMIN